MSSDLEGSVGEYAEVNGTSRVERFEADGSLIETLPAAVSDQVVALGFSPVSGHLLLTREFGFFDGREPALLEVAGTQVVRQFPFFSSTSVVTGEAVASNGRTYAVAEPIYAGAFGGASAVQEFRPVVYPDVMLSAPTDAGTTSVDLSGSVDPDGVPTAYRFEYSADGGQTWNEAGEENAGEGNGPVAVAFHLEGLEPALTYQVRLRANNSEVSSASPPTTFETLAGVPIATTGSASPVTASSAQLNGTVLPRGFQTVYWFEYGPTTALGSRLPADHDEVAGNGRQVVPVSLSLTGLNPGATFYYRLAAQSSVGPAYGETRSFTTGSSEPPARAFELVSPLDKGNVGSSETNTGTLAVADGDSVVFGTKFATYPGAESTVFIPRVRAIRTTSGWQSVTIDPPTRQETRYGVLFGTLTVSEDQTRALVASQEVLAPGATVGKVNLYIKSLETGIYTFIATVGEDSDSTYAYSRLLGTSPDLSTVVFASPEPILPGAKPPGQATLYEWTEGAGVSLLAVDSTGNPFSGNIGEGIPEGHEPDPVSVDGRRTYFTITNSPGESGLYLHEDGQPTRLVSRSHVAGDSPEPEEAFLLRAGRSGRFAIFVVPGDKPLTDDAPAEPGDAYRYDADTDELQFLAPGVAPENAIAYPDTGDMFYFSLAGGKNVPELPEEGAEKELYSEHAGVVSRIDGPLAKNTENYAASPNGRYVAFTARGSVTSFDSAKQTEAYRYDTMTERLECVSCRADGRVPVGKTQIGQPLGTRASEFANTFARSVLDDGTVMFDTAEPLVPSDTNGVSDVYEVSASGPRLISGGDSNDPATFLETTPSGDDVFFVTAEQLVPQDTDHIVDLYDARVGGGFAQAAAGQGPCEGETCRAAPSAPPPSFSGASEAVRGAAGPTRRQPASKRPVRKCSRRRRGHGKGGSSRCRGGKPAHKKTDKKRRSAR